MDCDAYVIPFPNMWRVTVAVDVNVYLSVEDEDHPRIFLLERNLLRGQNDLCFCRASVHASLLLVGSHVSSGRDIQQCSTGVLVGGVQTKTPTCDVIDTVKHAVSQ